MSAQHTITYAYPGSLNARLVGRQREGAYCLAVDNQIKGYTTYAEAIAAAAEFGTEPSRWSMDNPLNARFLNESHTRQGGAS